VTIVTACFISPFFFFSPLAGVLADKFSKRAIIVFWKYAEIAITGVALVGFLLPHAAGWGWASPQTLAVLGAALVVAAVFMMGTHSAFFIPAKYGIMPEILSTSVLSRGNGLLEGTSFTANILGTAFGGFCYAALKSRILDSGELEPGKEWLIGVVLLGLAMVGTLAARFIARIPAAAPDQPLIWQPWIPLKSSFAVLRCSRPLVLATVGIAFFTFMTLFLRQTLIFQGESAKDYHEYFQRRKTERVIRDKVAERARERAAEEAALSDDANSAGPSPSGTATDDFINPADVIPEASPAQRAELRIAMLAALVGLGVGIGCAAAGMLSGDRIELGLVPIGAVLMFLLTLALAGAIPVGRGESEWPTRLFLILVGIAAGLYIVPLYTVLQHRAPKESKGSLVAMSNFLNVSGGLVAIGVFYFLTYAFQSLFRLNLSREDAKISFEKLSQYVNQLQLQLRIPPLLFLAASLITLVMMLLLCFARPDFVLRTFSWFRVPGRRRLHAVGLSNVPADGHIILATNCHGLDQWLQVLSAIDRGMRFVIRDGASRNGEGNDRFLESVARGLRVLIPEPTSTNGRDWEKLVDNGATTLEAGSLIGLALDCPETKNEADLLLQELQSRVPSEVLPVYCGAGPTGHAALHHTAWRPIVAVGKPLPFGATPDQIRAAIHGLGEGVVPLTPTRSSRGASS
jgi:MFS family permease